MVDEAYHEFSRRTTVRSFELRILWFCGPSAGHGRTASRIFIESSGYCGEIAKAKLPYNLNVFSMVAAEAAVEHFDLLKPQIDLLIEERERVFQRLNEIPTVRAYPSEANFIAFETKQAPGLIFDALYEEGILVRDISAIRCCPSFANRIGPAEDDAFLEALRRIVMGKSFLELPRHKSHLKGFR
jgi:histidinol-phosphate aminotransferase